MTEPRLITKTKDLEQFYFQAKQQPFVTIDTEFIRERTYYSNLCLVQLAIPSEDPNSAILIDALSDNMKLDCLFSLFKEKNIVKVFHSARQDLEIFYMLNPILPWPIFDTQIAAMFCGFGHQVPYMSLVKRYIGKTVQKSARNTDWSQRPLSVSQKIYALSDVTYLRDIYVSLRQELEVNGRASWMESEVTKLLNPAVYQTNKRDAWKRIKSGNNDPEFLAIVRELADFRENLAQGLNLPRQHVISDQAILEMAHRKPSNEQSLLASRYFKKAKFVKQHGSEILTAIKTGMNCPHSERPHIDIQDYDVHIKSSIELLRVLRNIKAAIHGVAEHIIVPSDEIAKIASGNFNVCSMHGWRYEIFGHDAKRLIEGKIALTLENSEFRIIDIVS